MVNTPKKYNPIMIIFAMIVLVGIIIAAIAIFALPNNQAKPEIVANPVTLAGNTVYSPDHDIVNQKYNSLKLTSYSIEQEKANVEAYNLKEVNMYNEFGNETKKWKDNVKSQYNDTDFLLNVSVDHYNTLVGSYNKEISISEYDFTNQTNNYQLTNYVPLSKGYKKLLVVNNTIEYT